MSDAKAAAKPGKKGGAKDYKNLIIYSSSEFFSSK